MLKVIVVSFSSFLDENSQTLFEQSWRKKVRKINERKKHENKIFLFFTYSWEALSSLVQKNGVKGVIFQNEEKLFVQKITNSIRDVCLSSHKKTRPTFLLVKEGSYRTFNSIIIVGKIDLALELAARTPPILSAH